MTRRTRFLLAAAASLVALLTLGGTLAAAHGGPGRGGFKGGNAEDLVAAAAKELDVTAARLTTAITNAAVARIDEAVADDDLEAADATELKERARDNLGFAMRISRTRVVASNLGVTTTKLNDGFRAARKALILARINEAVADGDLTAAQAADLKADLEDAELPGYKPFGFHGFAGGFGHHGRK
jgi:hypothetical protein